MATVEGRQWGHSGGSSVGPQWRVVSGATVESRQCGHSGGLSVGPQWRVVCGANLCFSAASCWLIDVLLHTGREYRAYNSVMTMIRYDSVMMIQCKPATCTFIN